MRREETVETAATRQGGDREPPPCRAAPMGAEPASHSPHPTFQSITNLKGVAGLQGIEARTLASFSVDGVKSLGMHDFSLRVSSHWADGSPRPSTCTSIGLCFW